MLPLGRSSFQVHVWLTNNFREMSFPPGTRQGAGLNSGCKWHFTPLRLSSAPCVQWRLHHAVRRLCSNLWLPLHWPCCCCCLEVVLDRAVCSSSVQPSLPSSLVFSGLPPEYSAHWLQAFPMPPGRTDSQHCTQGLAPARFYFLFCLSHPKPSFSPDP